MRASSRWRTWFEARRLRWQCRGIRGRGSRRHPYGRRRRRSCGRSHARRCRRRHARRHARRCRRRCGGCCRRSSCRGLRQPARNRSIGTDRGGVGCEGHCGRSPRLCGCSGRSSGGCGRCPFSLRIRLVDLRICHPELCLQVAFLLRARCALNPWVLEKVHGALHQFLSRRHGPFASFLHSPPAPLPPNHGSYTPLLPPSPAITPHSGRSRKPPSWAAAPRKLVASSRSRPAAPADPRGARGSRPRRIRCLCPLRP